MQSKWKLVENWRNSFMFEILSLKTQVKIQKYTHRQTDKQTVIKISNTKTIKIVLI